jgi:hypothetical protein
LIVDHEEINLSNKFEMSEEFYLIYDITLKTRFNDILKSTIVPTSFVKFTKTSSSNSGNIIIENSNCFVKHELKGVLKYAGV